MARAPAPLGGRRRASKSLAMFGKPKLAGEIASCSRSHVGKTTMVATQSHPKIACLLVRLASRPIGHSTHPNVLTFPGRKTSTTS